MDDDKEKELEETEEGEINPDILEEIDEVPDLDEPIDDDGIVIGKKKILDAGDPNDLESLDELAELEDEEEPYDDKEEW